MEAIKPRLHPLLTAAAISVTVFSAVGVATLTGLIPHSKGQETAPVTASAPAPAETMPAPQPAAEPAAKPVVKHKARVAATSKPAHPVQVAEAAPAMLPPPPPVAQAPQPPAPVGTLGVVESVREVTAPAQSNGSGPIIGGIAGAVLGNQVGHGTGKTIATVLGAAGGAFAGKEIETKQRATKHWELTVRLDDGSRQTLSSPNAPYWHEGDRVRMIDGKLQPV